MLVYLPQKNKDDSVYACSVSVFFTHSMTLAPSVLVRCGHLRRQDLTPNAKLRLYMRAPPNVLSNERASLDHAVKRCPATIPYTDACDACPADRRCDLHAAKRHLAALQIGTSRPTHPSTHPIPPPDDPLFPCLELQPS